MNFIKQLRAFREYNKQHPLPMEAQALYYNIIQLFNINRWPEELQISSTELANDCSTTRKRISSARDILIQRGLIIYTATRRASSSPVYALVFLYDTHSGNHVFPFETHSESKRNTQKKRVYQNETHSESYRNTQPPENHDSTTTQDAPKLNNTNTTYNKHLNTTTIPKGIVVPDNIDSPKKRKVKKKASSAGAEKNATQHWQQLVDVWFKFYEAMFYEKPTFKGADAKNLKQIVDNLQKRSEGKGYEWTEEQACNALNFFINQAYEDKWLKSNFLIKNLNSQFDKIIADAQKRISSSPEKSVADGLDEIDAMYRGGKR